MKSNSNAKFKPLSFSTTLRNPKRFKNFLEIISRFENQELTNDLINKIVKEVIKNKFYKPNYITNNLKLSKIYNSDKKFSNKELEEIIINSIQHHKEKGFEKGWPSRFDTWFKILKEFGFIYYSINKEIKISPLAKLFLKASNDCDELSIFAIFTMTLNRYETNNIYRKNLNCNKPLILLLKVLKHLKKSIGDTFKGISLIEIPFLLCWKDNDYKNLANLIINLRQKYSYFNSTKEIYYEEILNYLGTTEAISGKYIKSKRLFNDSTDEYIRKMRETGLISIRGSGRYIDINYYNDDVVEYLIKNDATTSHESEEEYFYKNGLVDQKILKLFDDKRVIEIEFIQDKKISFLDEYNNANSYDDLQKEMENLKNDANTKDLILKNINRPTRLEFLTAAIFKRHFKNSDIIPNYICDDEGYPYNHASAGKSDILFYDQSINFPIEVTLISNTLDLFSKEIIPIRRHLLDNDLFSNHRFVILIAPKFHSDNIEQKAFFEHKDNIKYKFIEIDKLIETLSKAKNPLDLKT